MSLGRVENIEYYGHGLGAANQCQERKECKTRECERRRSLEARDGYNEYGRGISQESGGK